MSAVKMSEEVLRLSARVRTLEEALRGLSTVPAVLMALGHHHTANCKCPLCVARAVLRGGERSNVVTEGSTTYVRSLHPRAGR